MDRRLYVLLLAVGAALVLAAGCSDRDRITDPFGKVDDGGGDGGGGNEDQAAISGTTMLADGTARAMRVQVGDLVAYSDTRGSFILTGIDPAARIAAVTTPNVPPSWTTAYRSLRLSAGVELALPRVAILQLRPVVMFENGGGITVTNLDALGSGAVFPDSAYFADGAYFMGRGGARMAITRPSAANFSAAFPGEFRGRRLDGSEVLLDALGVLWTVLIRQANTVDLAPGAMVTYRLGADLIGGPAPASAIAWVLDIATGDWLEIGESPLVDGFYETSVSSIAPVCWANPTAAECEVAGSVVDAAGSPLANVTVVYQDAAQLFRRSALTGEDGTFSLAVRPSAAATVTAYFGAVVGTAVTVDTEATCPLSLTEPLMVVLPDYRLDLSWRARHGDLDAVLAIHLLDPATGQIAPSAAWTVWYLQPYRETTSPFIWLATESRDGHGTESIAGKRWYDGRYRYWVHAYTHALTDSLRASGARVDVVINDVTGSFAIADTPLRDTESDSLSWWHVCDIDILGADVTVVPVDTLAAEGPVFLDE